MEVAKSWEHVSVYALTYSHKHGEEVSLGCEVSHKGPWEGYRLFVRRMLERSVSFHPDTPMSEYVDASGRRVFEQAESAKLQAEHDELFQAVAAEAPRGRDPYSIAVEVFEEWQKS